MSSPVWFVELIKKTFPQIFTLADLTNIPGIGRIVEFALFENDNIMFLPRTEEIQLNRTIDNPGDIALPFQIVEHFINEANYHWIMNSCLCRDASTCKDYPIDLGCIFLGEAVIGINPKLGQRVTPQKAIEHAQRCRDAGLVHMIGRNKLDSVWLNVRPGHKLLTICNCCPCCCLWRIIPNITPDISSNVTRMPGVTVRVTESCEGCGNCCENICFVKAISMEGDHAVISDDCRGCGRCVDTCPNNAIEQKIEKNVHHRKS